MERGSSSGRPQFDREANALPLGIGGEKAAARGAHVALEQGQLQRKSGAARNAGEAVRKIKPAAQSRRGKDRAMIADFDSRLRGAAGETDLDASPRRAGLKCLSDKSEDGAPQGSSRELGLAPAAKTDRDRAAGSLCQGLQVCVHFFEQSAQRNLFLIRIAALLFRVLQEQVGDAHGAKRLQQRIVHRLRGVRGQGAGGLQELESSVEHGEGLAEVMNCAGEHGANLAGRIR